MAIPSSFFIFSNLLHSLTMIISLFFILIPFTTPLSFNFPSIDLTLSPSLNCTGDASISSQGIQLTPNPSEYSSNISFLQNKTGRATYFQPFRLWDNATQNLSHFSTNFSFVIQGVDYGEGLAFFLAPVGSSIPQDSAGGGLGLINVSNTTNSSDGSEFVAVEFDTYRNTWEDLNSLPVNHVGIDINSGDSVKFEYWDVFSGIKSGKTNQAWIKYDSIERNLSVVFTNFDANNGTVYRKTISHLVDLRAHLPEWVVLGFSASTGVSYESHRVISWEFASDFQIVEQQVKEKKSKTGLVVGLSVGLGVLACGLGLILCFLWRRRRGRREIKRSEPVQNQSMDEEFKRGTGPRKFSYEELEVATNNFSEEEKLGEGGFGGVYRGYLKESNSFVAVKRVSRGSKQGLKEYASEVKIISQLRHRNLVQLTGWCHDKNELLLVYEFLPNGSLDTLLFNAKSLLTWEVRYKIAQGLASALFYLHEEWEQCVVHRDLKASNVMLDSNFNAKLGDFGLAKLVGHEQAVQTTNVAGTMGYMAPEYFFTGKASKESDVYSFGIVALEIACGRKPIESQAQPNQTRMLEWVWELYGAGKVLEAADPKLGAEFDEKQMECLMIVGLWCAHPDYILRPSIRQAILVLNFEAPLPTLPTEMPVPMNSSRSSISSSYYGSSYVSSQVQSSNYSDNTTNSLKLPSSSAVYSSSKPLAHTK